MGIDIEDFVHPEHISPELICQICQGVVDRPVQTPSEHLFCEGCNDSKSIYTYDFLR
jgi:hypothetical protein